MGLVKVKLSKQSKADLQILFFALALLLFIFVQIGQSDDSIAPNTQTQLALNSSISNMDASQIDNNFDGVVESKNPFDEEAVIWK